MTQKSPNLRGLSAEQKKAMFKRMVAKREGGARDDQAGRPANAAGTRADGIPESHYRFDKFPEYQQIHVQRAVGERAGIDNPFFIQHEGCAADTTVIDGRPFYNFATYNYLDLNGDSRVQQAAAETMARYGVSASASRVVSGERPPHRALEGELARVHGTEDAVVFVSGHATNVSTIATLVGPKDLVLHDRLIHNSQLQGARLSGATRRSFPHNDMDALEEILAEERPRHQKVLICVEGLYSMDGDLAPLPRLIELKQRYKALLMVDEAHATGVVGATGRGVGEHFGISGADVDIWMGTLSKSLCGCGGFIAGSRALIEILKFNAPGFVYSVGMPPGIAAACHTALEIMQAEPERVRKLQDNGQRFLELCQARGLDTGTSAGFCVVPVIVGRSILTAQLANALFARGVNVQPIIYPAVEEKAARLRFFISSAHSHAQLEHTAELVAEELTRLRAQSEAAE
jgi:8-amino-7-oxononanoate synthase